MEFTDEDIKELLHIKELLKCRDDIIYFAENYVKLTNLSSDINPSLIKLYPKQKEILLSWKNNRRNIVNASRQFGVTTLYLIFLLHSAIFDKNISNVICSRHVDTSKQLKRMFKDMCNELPVFIRPIVERDTFDFMVFDNGTRIRFNSFNEVALRGSGINNLIMDNIDYVPSDRLDKFMLSAMAGINSSKTSKIIIGGTPASHDGAQNKYARSLYWNVINVTYKDNPIQDTPEWEACLKSLCSEEVFKKEFSLEYDS